MKQVAGSFVHEVLSDELIEEMSKVKVVDENAMETLPTMIRRFNKANPEYELKLLHTKLQVFKVKIISAVNKNECILEIEKCVT